MWVGVILILVLVMCVFNGTAATGIYTDGHTRSLHDAFPICLAQTYGKCQWLPTDPVGAARVQRWLSVAAGPLHAGPASARLITVFGAPYNAEEEIGRAHV